MEQARYVGWSLRSRLVCDDRGRGLGAQIHPRCLTRASKDSEL
jgi:hypothetical protein